MMKFHEIMSRQRLIAVFLSASMTIASFGLPAAAAEEKTENEALETQEKTAADSNEPAVLSAEEDVIKPYFDFDNYDWSDPAEYLNDLARKKYPYWDANATSGDNLLYYWNQPYYNDSWDEKTPVSKIIAKDYIKQKVDEGVFPTDEKFFGVWDSGAGDWTTEPMINYDYVSAYDSYLNNKLSHVADAAKDGNYEEAKEAYLAYHRELRNLNPLKAPSITTDMKNRSDMLMRNMYVHNSFPATAWFYMPQQESDISVDVTAAVEAKRSGKGAIVLVAPDKDEYRAEFYSKEALDGKYAPYIEATIGGGTVTFPVMQDAYVGGGPENYLTPFGTTDPDRLLVSESEDTEEGHTAVEGFLVGSGMRRTYLLFDFGSKIKSGDVITKATLKLRGKVNDLADTPRNDPSYKKLIFVTGLSTDDFSEDSVVFGSDVIVNGVYSEQSRSDEQQSFFWGGLKDKDSNKVPYPDSQFPNARMHEDPLRFSGWWDIIAQTYYATGNEDYARTAMLILHDFIKVTYCLASGESGTPARYTGANANGRTRGGHLLFGGYRITLDASQRSKIATSIQYLFNSEYMTPEIFTTFMKYIKVLGDKAVRDTWGSSENGNWGSMQIDGQSNIMFKYPELAYTKPNVPGGYLLNWETAISLHSDITCAVFEDGSGGELSQGYTHVALNRLLNLKRGADDVGYQLSLSDKTMKNITDLAKFLSRTCLPGVREAQYGDSNGVTNSYKNQAVRFVADWTKDPELLYVAYDGKKGKEPDFTSYYYPVGKFLIMRNSWDNNAMYLHTNADQANGAHSHWDDGAVIVAAYGNYLLADVGYLGYLVDNLPHRWQISSRGHNVVEINDYCQSSHSPNTMDTALVGMKTYNSASDKGTAKPSNGVGKYEEVVTGDNYDFYKLDLTHVYKDLGYLKDPVMAPGGNGVAPAREPGMTYKRNVLFLKDGFWIVSDYMDPVDKTKNNKYSQYWHMAPEANISIDGQYQLKDGETVKWSHSDFADVDKQIENTQYVPGTGTGAFKSNFDGKANITVVPADINSVDPKLCYGYYTNGYSTPYGRFDKYAVGTTKFDTILFPTKKNESYSVVPTPVEIKGLKDSKTDGSASAFTAEIKSEEAAADEDYTINYMILHEKDKKAGGELEFNNLSTNGDLAYYEVSGSEFNPTPRRAIFQNGTHLKNTALGYEVAYTNSGKTIDEVGIKWSGSQLEIETGNLRGDDGEKLYDATGVKEFLKGFTVYAPYEIKTVTLNGENISDFKQSYDYVYFGEKPILDGSGIPVVKPDDGKDNTNTPGGAHGTGGGSSAGAISGGNHGNGGSSGGNNGGSTVTPSKPSDKFNSELSGHWGETELRYLVDNGIVTGDGSTLKLSDNVTRAEFTAMILRAFKIEPKEYNGCASDVSGSEWYAGYIQTAYDMKILEGDGGKAMPDDIMTREQAVKIMLKALEAKGVKVSYDDAKTSFSDAGDISGWAAPFVSAAVDMNLIKGMENNRFMPKNNTLREQAMIMIYRLLSKVE